MAKLRICVTSPATITGCFYLAGQVCTASERVLVHDRVHDAFVEKLVARTRQVRVGNPLLEDTDMGPLNNWANARKVQAHIDDARARDLSYVEHGPRAELRVALGGRARLGLEAGATFRAYGAASAAGAPRRSDEVWDASALAEVDLGAHLTARAALLARRATSNLDAFEYDKIVPSLGLLWIAGY